jgi:hypothetical protein
LLFAQHPKHQLRSDVYVSFADPQSITLAAPLPVGAVSLPRVSTEKNSSTYASADRMQTLTASSQYGNRNRRLLRLEYSKVSADVFQPDINVQRKMACYLVLDTPVVGFTNAEIQAVWTAFKGNVTASSDAAITKLIGGES